MTLQAPFPWFGGKRRVADVVWRAFGDVPNFCEPFFGSGAVLLGRPQPFGGVETVNDIDGLVSNFWRAIKHSPEATAEWADWPVNENDLHARHAWLVSQIADLQVRLEGDPDWHDPKIAGWWVWGISCWIGGEFCSGKGPWSVVDGKLINCGDSNGDVRRRRVHLGSGGRGVNRQMLMMNGSGSSPGRGAGITPKSADQIYTWFGALSERLRRVRVCSGDWSRVCGPTVTLKHGFAGVFLDPPYSAEAGRDPRTYRCEDLNVAHAVRQWAIEAGGRPDMRIALCGYEGEHEMPPDWHCHAWKAHGGYGAGKGGTGDDNARRERIWFSPACLPLDEQMNLFAAAQ